MDWVRLTNGSADLAGTKGQMLRVTKEELAKHRSQVSSATVCLFQQIWLILLVCFFPIGGLLDGIER